MEQIGLKSQESVWIGLSKMLWRQVWALSQKKPLLLTFNPKKGEDVWFVAGVVTQNTAFGVLASKYLFALSIQQVKIPCV